MRFFVFAKFTFLYFFFSFLLSCSGDDEGTIDPVGTWTLTEARTTGCADPANRLDFVTTEDGVCAMQGGINVCVEASLVFSASGTYSTTTRIALESGTFILSDTKNGAGTWSVTGNTLEVCSDDGTCKNQDISGQMVKLTLSNIDMDIECTVSLIFEKG